MSSPWSIIANIAERRIQEAQEQGAFENLPGAGKPLDLEDDSHVPAELRMAYKLLRNAGYAPPELEQRKEINSLVDMLETCSDESEKIRQMQRLQCLLLKMQSQRQRPLLVEENDPYYQRILDRIRVVRRGMKNTMG